MTEIERHTFDVVVIGAGGAGLRAAIEARVQGKRTAIVCKSLFGKAHTVMAEGGAAAAMGNVNSNDNWQVHFRDTMRGGKFLNHWRMAELHAKEAPDRVWELETYGALFDRTKDGKISQRNFGGHEYPRLAHVGDRTGLEMIRTLQQKIVSLQQEDQREHGDAEAMIKVFAEMHRSRRCSRTASRIAGAVGYTREDGTFIVFEAPAVVLATGGIGKSFKVTSNSWEYTGDGHALAMKAGATLLNMEFVQFHPTGMVWPPSVKGILVTESVRGDGGVLKNSEGKRFMFDYVPAVFRKQYAETEEEADALVRGPGTTTAGRRSCCPATRSPGRSTPRSRPAAARPPAACSSTSRRGCRPRRSARSCRRCTTSSRSWPTSTSPREPMEVGPTCHYVMGGVEVDPDTAAAVVPGLFAAGEVSGGMHGSNRLGGNSLSDLLVFGRRAGAGAQRTTSTRSARRARRSATATSTTAQRDRRGAVRRRGRREPLHAARRAAADDERPGRHHPQPARRWSRRSSGSRSSRRAPSASASCGRQGLQPRLAPRARPAQHADRLRVHRPVGADPRGVAAAGTPATTSPAMSAAVAQGQPGLPRRRRRRRGRRSSRCR